jgi:hypothetical protein
MAARPGGQSGRDGNTAQPATAARPGGQSGRDGNTVWLVTAVMGGRLGR